MSKPKDKSKAPESPSFEKALARLEAIVEQLDDGNLGLDESIALFKEGTKLATICREKLAQAEVQIKDALDGADADGVSSDAEDAIDADEADEHV